MLEHDIDVVNLSNGSNDFLDRPFINKIDQLTRRGVTVVSAIGNEGPFMGTLSNPADLINVVGVGSLDKTAQNVASFSSRGMTTWSLLDGNGIIKPDLLTFGTNVQALSGTSAHDECTHASGTSISSSIATASIALAISQLEDRSMVNPAFIKENLMASSKRLPGLSITEQGAGVLDLD